MSGVEVSASVYTAVAVVFVLAFLVEGEPKDRRSTVVIIACGLFWPAIILAAACVVLYQSVRGQA